MNIFKDAMWHNTKNIEKKRTAFKFSNKFI